MNGVRLADQFARGAKAPVAAGTQAMDVVSESKNYLTCKFRYYGAAGSRIVYVAKPPNLRGHVAVRTNASFETEKIFPRYAAGDTVYAAVIAGGTDVVGGDGSWAIWQDLNVDARVWAVERDCEG